MSYYDEGYAGNPICSIPSLVNVGIGVASLGLLIFGGKHRWWGLAGFGFNILSTFTCPPKPEDIALEKQIFGHGY